MEPETEDLRQHGASALTLDASASTLRRPPGRGLLAAGAAAVLVLAGLLGYARWDAGEPGAPPASATRPAASPPDAVTPAPDRGILPRLFERPARLDLRVEHPLRSGRLKVWVDDALVAERELSAPVTKKIVVIKKRKEVLEETFELRPGEHTVRLQLSSGEDVYGSRIKGRFLPGETRRLAANLGGLILKNLELVWASSPATPAGE
jgi:hypothetical protein